MSPTVLTFILAFVLVLLAAVGLAIGYILTGRNKLRRMCGSTPNKKPGKDCGKDATCPLCEGEVRQPQEERD